MWKIIETKSGKLKQNFNVISSYSDGFAKDDTNTDEIAFKDNIAW